MTGSSVISRILPVSMTYGHFRYYWLALMTGVTGHQMLLQFTMHWQMFKLTGEPMDLALLGMAIAVPALALNLLGGVLADRFEPKFLVAAAQASTATVVVLLAISVFTGVVQSWHLLLAAVIIGAGQAVDQPSRASVSPRLVRPEHIVNAVAMDSLVWNTVRIAGPVLAGIIIERVSIEASMFFSAATFYILATVVSLLRMRPRPPSRGQVLQQIGESLSYVRRHLIFLHVMLLTFCNSLFGMAYIGLMPVFAEEVLHVGPEKIGWLLGASGVGAILGTWMVGNLKEGFPKGRMILGGSCALRTRPYYVRCGGGTGALPRVYGPAVRRGHGQLVVPCGRPKHDSTTGAGPVAGPGHGLVRHYLEPVAAQCVASWNCHRLPGRAHRRGGGGNSDRHFGWIGLHSQPGGTGPPRRDWPDSGTRTRCRRAGGVKDSIGVPTPIGIIERAWSVKKVPRFRRLPDRRTYSFSVAPRYRGGKSVCRYWWNRFRADPSLNQTTCDSPKE